VDMLKHIRCDWHHVVMVDQQDPVHFGFRHRYPLNANPVP
jgi:hypothetical protein